MNAPEPAATALEIADTGDGFAILDLSAFVPAPSANQPAAGALPIAPSLSEQLEAGGWRRGSPAHITLASRRIDAAACRRLPCPGCGRRGLAYRPFHKGGRYRVVAGPCPGCGSEAEL
jgi:hypothetical protein